MVFQHTLYDQRGKIDLFFTPLGVGSIRSLSAPTAPTRSNRNFVDVGHELLLFSGCV